MSNFIQEGKSHMHSSLHLDSASRISVRVNPGYGVCIDFDGHSQHLTIANISLKQVADLVAELNARLAELSVEA